MTEEEKQERDGPRETKRAKAASSIAVVAALSALVQIVVLVCIDDFRARWLLEPILALTLAVLITFGVRAVDGPITMGSRRRDAAGSSRAAASVLLWLGCFGAIQTAFVVVELVAKWEEPSRACAAADSRFRGDVDLVGPHGTRRMRLAGCARLIPRSHPSIPETSNPQHSVAPADDDEVGL